MLKEFEGIVTYIIIVGLITGVILVGSYLVAEQTGGTEKMTAYECGFDAFEDTRAGYDIKYYLVAIMFIVFDLEASYLFPWSVVLNKGKLDEVGYYGMLDFIGELLVGYVYLWRKGMFIFK